MVGIMVTRLRIPAFLAMLALSSAVPAEGQPTRRALLIGINAYKAVPPLSGCVNDVLRMQQILKSKYGFTQFHKLTDAQATRAAIVAAFKRIVAEAGPGDIVYVHFSGHGSQCRDFSGDEKKTDRLDETLIPVNGRTPGVRDITDDEIAIIFAGFKTDNVVIVFDSCHSGTATRSVAIRTRGVERDKRDDLYKNAPRTRAVTPVSARFVAFGGAASHQQALDGPCEGRAHGLFTYALSRALAKAPPNTSLRGIMKQVGVQQQDLMVKLNLSSMPTPQLEGPAELLERPIFSTRGAPAPAPVASKAWVPVLRITGKKELLLPGAVALGARKGAVWAIYRSSDTQFKRPLARADVKSTSGSDAIATSKPAGAMILSGARAVMVAAPRAVEPVSVCLYDVPDEERAKLAAALRSVAKHIRVVGKDQASSFVVDHRGGEWVISGATGTDKLTAFRELDHIQVAARMAAVMTRSQAATELMSLNNPNSSMQLDVRLAGQPQSLTEQLTQHRGLKITATAQASPFRLRREGEASNEQNCVVVEVAPSRDSYLTIVGVDAVGEVMMLFPNSISEQKGFHKNGFVRGGQLVRIPDSVQDNNRAGFVWECAEPLGTTTIRVFASTDLDTAQMIRKFVGDAATRTRSVGKGDPTQALGPIGELREALITRAVHVVSSGGAQQPPPAPNPQPQPGQPPSPPVQQPTQPAPQQYQPPASDWTATTVTFEVGG